MKNMNEKHKIKTEVKNENLKLYVLQDKIELVIKRIKPVVKSMLQNC
jgi:hypothetical protein